MSQYVYQTSSSLPNLPIDVANNQMKFFNNYNQSEINYNPSEVDAVVGYFLKRGFDQTAAINTATVLLQQSYLDGIKVFQLIDTLKGLTDVQLNDLIAQIINLTRSKCSTIGYRINSQQGLFDQRNIIV
jgi:glycyl-tRNA synthetase alpha subunit